MNKKKLVVISERFCIVSITLVICLLSACTQVTPPVANFNQLEGRIEAVHRLQGVPVLNIDTNHDYRITEDEFVAYAKRTYEAALKRFDRNGDGFISAAEYISFKKNRTAIMFKIAMDTNSDMQISEKEFDVFHQANLAAMTGSSHGNTMLSSAHIVAQAKKRFAQLDTNRDGMLDSTELPETIEKPYYGDRGNYPKNKTRASDGWSHSGGWYYTGCERPAPKPCWPVFYPTPGCSPWFGCFQGDGPDPSGPDDPPDPCEEDPFGCDCVFSSSWPCSEW